MNRRNCLQTMAAGALATHLSFSAEQRKTKIKVGQIGTKHAHAGGKVATLRKFSDDFEVVGVVEPDKKQRDAVQDSAMYRGLPWMTEEQLLNTAGLQAVAVETEVCDLVPTAARCVAADQHVHLDKPAGESLPAFQKLLDEASRRKRVVQMGYMFRYNPAFQFLFQAVKDGWLGEIFEVHGVISKTVGDATRRQLAEYPGGSMFELGCHLIDPLVTILGKPAKVASLVRRTRSPEDELADNQLAVFEFEKATATIRSALVEVDGGRRRQFIVCGTQGTIEIKPIEPPHLTLTLDRPRGDFQRGTREVELPRLEGRYDGDFADLARVIRGEKQHDWPPAHDLAVHEAILLGSGLPLG